MAQHRLWLLRQFCPALRQADVPTVGSNQPRLKTSTPHWRRLEDLDQNSECLLQASYDRKFCAKPFAVGYHLGRKRRLLAEIVRRN